MVQVPTIYLEITKVREKKKSVSFILIYFIFIKRTTKYSREHHNTLRLNNYLRLPAILLGDLSLAHSSSNTSRILLDTASLIREHIQQYLKGLGL